MAQVPYQPYPTVEPAGGGESISINTPGAAFGENIGRTVEGLGKSLEQGGGEIFQRAIAIQDLANETEARNQDAEYAKQQGTLHADFLMKRGADARAALPGFLQQSDDLRKKYRNSLSNPAAQRLFDASSLGFMIRNVNSASIHAGTEFKNYAGAEAMATAKRAAESYVNPDNEEEVAHNKDVGRAAIQSSAQIEGWGPERTQEALDTFDRGQKIGQIKAIAEKGNVPKAWEMLENSKEVLGDKYEAVREKVWTENEKRASKVYVDRIVNPDKSDADMAREVEQLVNDPKTNLGDPNFGIVMRNELESRIRKMNTQQRLAKADDTKTIYRAINNGASTFAEVDATPEGHAALDALERDSPKEFLKLKKDIPLMAGRRDFETEQRSMNILQTLSRDDPTKFLEQDLFDPRWKISRQDRDHWLNERDRIIKNNGTSVKDPIVSQGINYIQAAYATQMKAAGLVNDQGRRVKDDNWDSFWGYVDTSIRDYQQHNNKQPDKKALDEIAQQAFVNHSEPRFMQWLVGPSKVPEYNRSFTEQENDIATRELRKANPDSEPDKVQVRRWLIQKQWNDHHQGGSKTEEAVGGGQPTPPRPQ